MIPSVLLALALAVAPPSTGPVVLAPDPAYNCTAQVPLSPRERQRSKVIAQALRSAEAKASEDLVGGIPDLQRALNLAHDEPLLVARDSEASVARRYAQMALAGGWLANHDRVLAIALLDRALALAFGDKLPVKLYGPSLTALHAERQTAYMAEPLGRLEVACDARCIVVVDATFIGCAGPDRSLAMQLPEGNWDVVLAASANPAITKSARVTSTDQKTVAVHLDVEDLGGEGYVSLPKAEAYDTGRRLPRWAGITGMALGAAAMIAGGVAIGLDRRCPDLSPSQVIGNCTRRLNIDGVGMGVLVTGASVLVGFTIPFAIGESRAAAAKRGRRHGAAQVAHQPYPPPSWARE